MKFRKRHLPEINTGSMADIAFLLLIFFLVTTTIDVDAGIQRKLPPIEEGPVPIIHQRNVLTILINANGKLMVEDQEVPLKELHEATLRFLDNNRDQSCSYCEGPGHHDLFDNPQKAVISLQSDRHTTYQLYVAVQNELNRAYQSLRNREAERLYGRKFEELDSSRQKKVSELFPKKISEAEPFKL